MVVTNAYVVFITVGVTAYKGVYIGYIQEDKEE